MRHVRRAERYLVSALALAAGLGLLGTDPSFADEPEEEAKDLIVMVRCELGGTETYGAGIIVGTRSDRLYIATANHVVRKGIHDAEDLRVELRSLPGESIEANLLDYADEDLDLAVLNVAGLSQHHISLDGLRFDVLGNAEGLQKQDPVFHVGNRSGYKWRPNLKADLISEVLATELRFESSLIAPGSSGGGLFDERWNLVGLVRADHPPDGVAIRIDRVLERLEGWGYPVDLTPSPRAADPEVTTSDTEIPANAVEGWAIIGYYQQGRFSDMAIELPGDAPAIGNSYKTVETFRMVAEKPERERRAAVITLGIVPEGSTVQVLDLEIEPSYDRVPVHARLRAVVERVERGPSAPAPGPRPMPGLVAPRPRGPECGSTIPWSASIMFSWHEVEGASTYTVEVDCFGCSGSGRNWYTLATGRPWHVKKGLGRRSPIYSNTSNSVGTLLREAGGFDFRWRVWAVDPEGREGAKSDWCQVALSGSR